MIVTLPESFLNGETSEPSTPSSASTRYIVQVYTEAGTWAVYQAKGSRRGGKYTLTVQEAFAYLWTLKEGVFRVVKSVSDDGLVNQSVEYSTL